MRRIAVAAPVDGAVLNALRHEPGVEAAESLGNGPLCLRYDLRDTGMDVLLPWLQTRGVRFDVHWRPRLQRLLAAYTDIVAREALGDDSSWESALRRVYAGRNRPQESGRHDERAHDWHRYLARTDIGS
jgi:hypothetical protein